VIAALALRRADDALILGHRLSEWTGHAPTLEEELALANLGLDLIGQARGLYQLAADIENNTEDHYAYFRDERAFRNVLLVELPKGDFAFTMVRQLLYAAFAHLYWQAMVHATSAGLAAVAAKAEKEMEYHVRHAADWTVRLGDGTEESHRRTQAALDRLWPYTGELFEAEDPALVADGAAVDPPSLRAAWLAALAPVFAEATLTQPADRFFHTGGRAGRHTEHLGHLLAEMQHIARSHPEATW
jgi:ring-1,2-phenylacetyl-CoA epoxidase subunit PaaC